MTGWSWGWSWSWRLELKFYLAGELNGRGRGRGRERGQGWCAYVLLNPLLTARRGAPAAKFKCSRCSATRTESRHLLTPWVGAHFILIKCWQLFPPAQIDRGGRTLPANWMGVRVWVIRQAIARCRRWLLSAPRKIITRQMCHKFFWAASVPWQPFWKTRERGARCPGTRWITGVEQSGRVEEWGSGGVGEEHRKSMERRKLPGEQLRQTAVRFAPSRKALKFRSTKWIFFGLLINAEPSMRNGQVLPFMAICGGEYELNREQDWATLIWIFECTCSSALTELCSATV